jgi:hypothetical protein
MHGRHRTQPDLAMTAVPGTLRPRTVAELVGGRAAYRLATYAAGIVLLSLWGSTEFALFAAAVGAVGWVFVLTSSGPEKAALALVPRTDGAMLERTFVWLAVVPFAAISLGTAALMVSDVGPTVRVYAAATAASAGVGCCAVLVGLYRLRGRPRADALAYCSIAGGFALAVTLAAGAGFGVLGVLAVLWAVPTAVAATLLAGLLRRPGPAGATRGSVLEALRAAAVLGVSEVLGTAAVSVLFAVLALIGDATETSRFYLLMIVGGGFATGWSYLLRLVQPRVAARLEREGQIVGWHWVGRLSRWTAVAGGAATAAAIAVGYVRGPGWPAAVFALLLEMALYAAVTAALLVVENTDAHGRRSSAAAALVQFATVAAAAFWLVPVAGAAGALAALCVGVVARAVLLIRFAGVTIGRNTL